MPQPRKLTDDEVRDIRRSGLSQGWAARKYGVHRKTIRNIRQGLTYQDVPNRAPTDPDAHLMFTRKYLVGDVLELLGRVPEGYAETVLTMAPILQVRPAMPNTRIMLTGSAALSRSACAPSAISVLLCMYIVPGWATPGMPIWAPTSLGDYHCGRRSSGLGRCGTG